MPRTLPAVVIPNPDDATNGVIVGTEVTVFRNGNGVPFFRVFVPGDPDGTLELPLSTLAAADRVKARDFALACLAVFKTARGYV